MYSNLNDKFGEVKPKQSSEARAVRPANLEKFIVRVLLFVFLIIEINLSSVPKEENAAGFQICADEMDSAGIIDQMVTRNNLNTANAIARECGILTGKGLAIKDAKFQEKIEEKLPVLIPAMQGIWLILMRIAITLTMVVPRSGEKILYSFREIKLRMAVLQCVWLILMRFAIWLMIVVRRNRGQILMFGKILLSFQQVNLRMVNQGHNVIDGGIWSILMRIAITLTMVVRRSGGKILYSFWEIKLRMAVLQCIWLILTRFATWLMIVVRSRGQVVIFGQIFFSFQEVNLRMAPSWSQLPNVLISTVVNRLTTIEDFTASSQVCRDWHSVCLNMNWTPGPQPPWLMLSENPISNRRSFFSLYNNLRYELELPTVRGRCCYGTAQGWIIAVGPDLQAHLLDPLHQVKIDLPALQNQVGVPTDWFNYIQKFIAFKNSYDQFLVMAIYGPSSCLAFAKPGDSEWVIFRNGCKFKDVTYFKRYYYALCGSGVLKRCGERVRKRCERRVHELRGPHSEVRFMDLPPRDLERTDKMYLVESSRNLYAVFRYGSADVSDKCYKTKSFRVYKFQFNLPDDFPLPRWARVADLEDIAFFVGNGNSWSVCASNIVRRNCIYFTDDNWGQQSTIGGTYGGHDIGVFDMATKKIEYLNFGVDTPDDYSRSIWFRPTLQHNEGSRPIWLTPTLP